MSTTAYYTVNNPTDPLAMANKAARQATYDAWKTCAETVGPIDANSRDWDEHLATLTPSIGTSKHRIEHHVIAFTILARLPRLQALVEEMMHIETYVLTRIADVLRKIDPALDADESAWALIDEELSDYLTPTKPAQVLPSPENIVRKLKRILLALQEEIPTPPPDPEKDRDTGYSNYPDSPESTTLGFSHDNAMAAILAEIIRTLAMAQGMTMVQAHAALLLGNADVRVHLNLYQAHDVEDAPMFLADNTMVSVSGQEMLAPLITATRDIDAVAGLVTEGYQPTGAQKAFIEGRDGFCRWAGCGRLASECDKDHRVNYDEGGQTTTDQMASLCRPHHNRKTDGLVYYLLDEHTGNAYWLYEDGTWVVDEPKGPLAPVNRRWVSTLADRLKRRRVRLWQKNVTPPPGTEQVPAEDEEEPPF